VVVEEEEGWLELAMQQHATAAAAAGAI